MWVLLVTLIVNGNVQQLQIENTSQTQCEQSRISYQSLFKLHYPTTKCFYVDNTIRNDVELY
jgi:hypothetical protein